MGLVLLIEKGQNIRNEKQRLIETEIAELQLKTIKNQVDPHFVFNAINTLSELHLMDNKLEADQFIVEFSDLMRKTLSQSDKISTELETEIKYVENYLRLQRIRLNNTFSYAIKIDKNVDQTMTIPKHALYTYVENAVKYGLTNTSETKSIIIDIQKEHNCILLQVIDNGQGVESKKAKRISTGTGLNIMSQIFKLYEKRFRYTIKHSVETIFDKENTTKGTKAEVRICRKKRK